MSGHRSNIAAKKTIILLYLDFSEKGGNPAAGSPTATLLRLHPSHETYLSERSPRRVKLPASGILHFHGVTGGVYKTRERIHRDMLIRDY